MADQVFFWKSMGMIVLLGFARRFREGAGHFYHAGKHTACDCRSLLVAEIGEQHAGGIDSHGEAS